MAQAGTHFQRIWRGTRQQLLLTGVPRPSKRAAIHAYVRQRGWTLISAAEWGELRSQFPDASESALRTVLAGEEISVDQPFAGVAMKTLEQLKPSLIAMADVYCANPGLQGECRAQVIAAKDRARFAALNANAAAEKRAVKAEMVEWMLVWLGDPSLFEAWVELRERVLYCNSTEST